MISINDLKIRFERDPLPLQWGAIASDLSRLSSIISSGSIRSKTFENVLIETKFFTEWLAPNVDLKGQTTILSLQQLLSRWSNDSGQSSEQIKKNRKYLVPPDS